MKNRLFCTIALITMPLISMDLTQSPEFNPVLLPSQYELIKRFHDHNFQDFEEKTECSSMFYNQEQTPNQVVMNLDCAMMDYEEHLYKNYPTLEVASHLMALQLRVPFLLACILKDHPQALSIAQNSYDLRLAQ